MQVNYTQCDRCRTKLDGQTGEVHFPQPDTHCVPSGPKSTASPDAFDLCWRCMLEHLAFLKGEAVTAHTGPAIEVTPETDAPCEKPPATITLHQGTAGQDHGVMRYDFGPDGKVFEVEYLKEDLIKCTANGFGCLGGDDYGNGSLYLRKCDPEWPKEVTP